MISNKQPAAAFILLLFIVNLVAGKSPPPPGAPWAKFVSKPAFARSLGPPVMTGFGTLPVPYVAKPGLFPKFVDPRIMIAKKTNFLANLFGGLGPASPYGGYGSTPDTNPAGLYGPEDANSEGNAFSNSGSEEGEDKDLPILYASGFGEELNPKINKYLESIGSFSNKDSEEMENNLKRGLFGFGDPQSSFGNNGDSGNSEHSTLTETSTETSSTQGPPPSYPNIIHVIPEEEEEKAEDKEAKESPLEKIFSTAGDEKSSKYLAKRTVADDSIPKEYLPGMYGPMGPFFGPPGAGFAANPFMSQKSMFLDTLFKNLATSTPSPVTETEVPVPKSTIVPPSFWIPESVIPEPGAYSAKVATFLDKLFESLKLNASSTPEDSSMKSGGKIDTARSLPSEYSKAGSFPYSNAGMTKTTRSLTDPTSVFAVKDQILNSIVGELGILRDEMVSTFNDLIAYQKNVSTPVPGTKPFKSFVPPFWSSSAMSIEAGTLPYKQRMIILDQVFDMLVELQTNISTAVNNAIKSNYEQIKEQTTTTVLPPEVVTFDISVLDAIQKKLNDINLMTSSKLASSKGVSSKLSRALPAFPTSFWVSYPGTDSIKRNLVRDYNNSPNIQHDDENTNETKDIFTSDKDLRAIKMQMHQGYQSLPPGAIETVQAGGGSVPGHEGGGVKLFIKMPANDKSANSGTSNGPEDYRNYAKWQDWSKNMEKEYQDDYHQHHHNRH